MAWEDRTDRIAPEDRMAAKDRVIAREDRGNGPESGSRCARRARCGPSDCSAANC